jgi:glycosyltransferase involved in cell wall biosynthesis
MRKEFAGCGFYRMYQPHNHLAKNYDVQVLITNGLSQFPDAKLKMYDIAIWHKAYFDFDDIQRAKSLGILTIADFDDHWILPREHIFFQTCQKDNTSSKLHRLIRAVDVVTCTTDLLADAIYKHNRKVYVLENAFDANYEGCKPGRTKDKNFVFGYLGGHTHTRDILELRGLQRELTLTESGYEFRLFGYDGGWVYKRYADILSDTKQSKNFSLFKGADIWNYPRFYNYMDCLLVPLEDTKFNSMKSELKLIEAGFFKKPVIVSDVMPYSPLAKYCLAVKRREDWARHCRRLLKEKNLARDLGETLYEAVQRFSIEKINKKRYKLYRDVLNDRNINSSNRPCRVVEFN